MEIMTYLDAPTTGGYVNTHKIARGGPKREVISQSEWACQYGQKGWSAHLGPIPPLEHSRTVKRQISS